MPLLKFGVQKLVNQWVNVNKEHAIYGKDDCGNNTSSSPNTESKIRGKELFSKENDDGGTIVTCSTADATSSVSTQLTSLSQMSQMKMEVDEVPRSNKAPLPNSPSLMISLEHLSFLKRIRRGSFGPTYTGKWKTSVSSSSDTELRPSHDATLRVAIQVVTTNTMQNAWILELNKLKPLFPHPNLVNFFGCVHLSAADLNTVKTYGLVSQLVYDPTHLTKWLSSTQSSPSASKLNNYYCDILEGLTKGLSHLHSHQVVHGCLKPENILLRTVRRKGGNDVDIQVKITDFGFTNVLRLDLEDSSKEKSLLNRYSAPEHIREPIKSNKIKFTCSSDIYSLGMISWHMITREVPFSMQVSDDEVFDNMSNNVSCGTTPRPRFPEETPIVISDFIEQCWADSPNERPCANEINQKVSKELRNSLLDKTQSMRWISDLRGHPVYFDEVDDNTPQPSLAEEKEDESSHDIPHKKMSLLSVKDKTDQDKKSTENSKRNLDMDISMLTPSQRKGLLRIKRPKFTRNRQQQQQTDRSSQFIEKTKEGPSFQRDDLQNDIRASESFSSLHNSIPFAPQLIPGGLHILNGPMPTTATSAIPLFQPILPGPRAPYICSNEKKELAGIRDTYLANRPPISFHTPQILHFDHGETNDTENINNDDIMGKVDLTPKASGCGNTGISFPSRVEQQDLIEGQLSPPPSTPENRETIFRGLDKSNTAKTKQEILSREALDALEVLSSQFASEPR